MFDPIKKFHKQLTDLYNQAQKEAVVPVTEKKPRPNKRKIIEDAVWDKRLESPTTSWSAIKTVSWRWTKPHRELGRGYAATELCLK